MKWWGVEGAGAVRALRRRCAYLAFSGASQSHSLQSSLEHGCVDRLKVLQLFCKHSTQVQGSVAFVRLSCQHRRVCTMHDARTTRVHTVGMGHVLLVSWLVLGGCLLACLLVS
jgi:hypothetical protein